ncbi:gas vesicle protein [Candidatus Poribacteria bacterium]|nr:gas vesicle protein [Candidatus Poribacteria bacterium]
MVTQQTAVQHAMQSDRLADILERVLDKGIVIAGDIRIKLVDIELLTIQIRLVIASVDKAREMGMDWWTTSSYFSSKAKESERESEITQLKKRIEQLEEKAPATKDSRNA